LEGILINFYFLFAFAADGIGIAVPWWRPKRWRLDMRPDNKSAAGTAKEGVLAATTNNETQIPHGTRIKDCVQAVCDSSGDSLRPYAAGESR
jgi:hypothetical protein